MKISLTSRRWAPLAVASAAALVLVACGSGNDPENATAEGGDESSEAALSGEVVIDGSSTVFPLTSAAAELFQAENPDVQVSVGNSGTGGGFEKFCAGETDISDASRPIEDDEIAICEENGISSGRIRDRQRRPYRRRQPRERLGYLPDGRAAQRDLGAGLDGQQLEPGRPVVPGRAAGAGRCRAPTRARSTTSPTPSMARKALPGPTTKRPRTTT